jgi:threonine/homoserine/homoserine lactone efflux protein
MFVPEANALKKQKTARYFSQQMRRSRLTSSSPSFFLLFYLKVYSQFIREKENCTTIQWLLKFKKGANQCVTQIKRHRIYLS